MIAVPLIVDFIIPFLWVVILILVLIVDFDGYFNFDVSFPLDGNLKFLPLQDVLEKNLNALNATDRTWKVEQCFITGMAGDAGGQCLQNAFCKLLPDSMVLV